MANGGVEPPSAWVERARSPLPGASPGGEYLRWDEDYEAIREEINRYNSPRRDSPPAWTSVVERGIRLLSERSKDLHVAVYLTVALFETRGYAGLRDGLEVLAAYLEDLWPVLFPPMRRMRARVSVLSWLYDWLESAIGRVSPAVDDYAQVRQCLTLLERCASAAREKIEEAPPTGAHVRQLLRDHIQVLEPQVAAQREEALPVERGAATADGPSGAGQGGAGGEESLPRADAVSGVLKDREEAPTPARSLSQGGTPGGGSGQPGGGAVPGEPLPRPDEAPGAEVQEGGGADAARRPLARELEPEGASDQGPSERPGVEAKSGNAPGHLERVATPSSSSDVGGGAPADRGALAGSASDGSTPSAGLSTASGIESRAESSAASRPESRDEAPVAARSKVSPEPLRLDPGVQRQLKQLVKQVQPLVTGLQKAAPASPVSYQLSRAVVWALFDRLPPATGGKTRIPGPAKSESAYLEQAFQAGNFAEVVETAESRFLTLPLWLDLQWWVWRGLDAGGEAYRGAAEVVAFMARSFVGRLSGIEALAFRDGTPLLSPSARAWLQQSVGPRATSTARTPPVATERPGAPSGEWQAVVAEARDRAARAPQSALAWLEAQSKRVPTGKERFRARLDVANLALELGWTDEAALLLKHLEQVAIAHELETWDEPLAGALWAARLRAELAAQGREQSPAGEAEIDRLLAKLCAIDIAAAVTIKNS